MKIIGESFDRIGFREHLKTIRWDSWRPSLICVHHTAAPSLKQRPNGLTRQHLENIKEFYEGKGWSAGPHIFIDDLQIWVFSPLGARGVHAVSFNRSAIGIEMLGDYDVEDPWVGRGAEVLDNCRAAILEIFGALKMDVSHIRFHRDDPKTSKTCPGTRIDKKDFLKFIANG